MCVVSSFSGIDWKNYVCHYMKFMHKMHKKQYNIYFLNGKLAKKENYTMKIHFETFFVKKASNFFMDIVFCIRYLVFCFP